MREPGSEALIRCGGCGHSRQEHRNDDTCIVPVCTCAGYLSMDRVPFPWTGREGTWFPAGNVMTRSHSGLGTDEKSREPTSGVIGESRLAYTTVAPSLKSGG